jgi:hypothetical protein
MGVLGVSFDDSGWVAPAAGVSRRDLAPLPRNALTLQTGLDLVRSDPVSLPHRDRSARLRSAGRALDRLRADAGAIAVPAKWCAQWGVNLVRMDEMETAAADERLLCLLRRHGVDRTMVCPCVLGRNRRNLWNRCSGDPIRPVRRCLIRVSGLRRTAQPPHTRKVTRLIGDAIGDDSSDDNRDDSCMPNCADNIARSDLFPRSGFSPGLGSVGAGVRVSLAPLMPQSKTIFGDVRSHVKHSVGQRIFEGCQ